MKLLLLFMLVLVTIIKDSCAIKCYQCYGLDNTCTVGLLGNKTECPPTTTSCYKSWTVETSPMTKRKCGDERVYEQKCNDVLFGQMSMLACYCSSEDFCNTATSTLGEAASLFKLLSISLLFRGQL
eukprot:13858.XXX_247224_246558_1 [CDS] Oithona nana genome sequencing.